MAYNPFNIFRRNQKVLFAVLTVFIMIMFTLSSGVVGADFFETFSKWLGSKGRKGEQLASIEGSKVTDADLSQLRFKRVMANRFMSLAAFQTTNALDKAATEQTASLSPDARQVMQRVAQSENMIRQFAGNPQFANNPQIMDIIQRSAQESRLALQQLSESPTAKAEDKEVARAKIASMILARSRGDHYFQFAPNQTQRDLLSFMLWQKKADQLGIYYTTDDIKRLVQREFFNFFRDEAQTATLQSLRKGLSGFTDEGCISAIGEEFRVRAAQAAVVGSGAYTGRGDKTLGAFPSFSPSYEAFDYYRDKCSPTTYAAIPVPAENFLAEVDRRMALPAGNPERIAEPSDDELRKLFDQYKDDVPNPARETPGFKTSPKARLDWMKITGEEPYYREQGAIAVKAELIAMQLRPLLESPLLTGQPALAPFCQAFVTDPQMLQAYERIVREHQRTLASRYFSSFMSGTESLVETSVVRPGNMGVATAAMAGQFGGLGTPLAGIALTASGPMAYEIRDRVKVGIPVVLGGLPGPAIFNTLVGGTVAADASMPKALPLEAYRADFQKNMVEAKAKELVFGAKSDSRNPMAPPTATGDLEKFITEVNKLSENGKAKDKGPALKYITEFVEKRKLTVRGNKTLLTEWNLEEDPELAPLVAAHKEAMVAERDAARLRNQPFADPYIPFARSFFWKPSPTGRPSPVSGTFVAERYPENQRDEKANVLVWRVEETPAAQVNFIGVKDSVRTAWKRNKARELAKDRAEAVAKAIRDSGKTDEHTLTQLVRDEAEKLRGPVANDPKAEARTKEFPILGVSPFTSRPGNATGESITNLLFPRNAFPTPYHFFRLVPSENLKYPSSEFQTKILDERTKPAGTVMVLPDAPKDTFFVVTLLKREEKKEFDFKSELLGGELSDRLYGGSGVLASFAEDARNKSALSVMGLLKQEFKYEETEEQKKRLDENDKRGGE